MGTYLLYAVMLSGLPVFYWLVLEWQKPYFELENNKNKTLLKSIPEWLVLLSGEVVLLKRIYQYHNGLISSLMLILLYLVLVMMTTVCVTDLWEKIVPNRILLLTMLLGFLLIGGFCLKTPETVMAMLPSMILGFFFCFLTFGGAYLIGKGGLGSGDVKLSFVLGILLTGEFVVGVVFWGCLVGAVYAIVQLCRKKLTRKDELPFVPFLYIGLMITYLAG